MVAFEIGPFLCTVFQIAPSSLFQFYVPTVPQLLAGQKGLFLMQNSRRGEILFSSMLLGTRRGHASFLAPGKEQGGERRIARPWYHVMLG